MFWPIFFFLIIMKNMWRPQCIFWFFMMQNWWLSWVNRKIFPELSGCRLPCSDTTIIMPKNLGLLLCRSMESSISPGTRRWRSAGAVKCCLPSATTVPQPYRLLDHQKQSTWIYVQVTCTCRCLPRAASSRTSSSGQGIRPPETSWLYPCT